MGIANPFATSYSTHSRGFFRNFWKTQVMITSADLAQLKNRLALAFIMKNEGRYAIEMLNSILPVVGFVSCIDTGSNDDSVDLIASYLTEHGVRHCITSTVFTDFSSARNLSLDAVPPEFAWTLILDCDEVILSENYKDLLSLTTGDVDAWWIPRYNWIDRIGGSYAQPYPDRQGRLLRNKPEQRIRFKGAIHEQLADFSQAGEGEAREEYTSETNPLHIHHIKLFRKSGAELEQRELLYRTLTAQPAATLTTPDDLQKNSQLLFTSFLSGKTLSDEKTIPLDCVRTLHTLPVSDFSPSLGSVLWAEWDHPLETPRPLGSIFGQAKAYRWPNYIKRGATCIDIGAHSGDTSIPMALLANGAQGNAGDGLVIAVEPNPDVFPVLSVNAALNSQLAKIVPLRAAICGKDFEQISLFDHGNANCNGGIIGDVYSEGLKATLNERAKIEFKAIGIRLRTLVAWLTPVERAALSFVKIDCEGYDKEILKQEKDFFMEFKPIIQIEWFDWFSTQDTDDLFSAINLIGYSAHDPVTLENASPQKKIPDLMLFPR